MREGKPTSNKDEQAMVEFVTRQAIDEHDYPKPTPIEGEHLADLPLPLQEKIKKQETITAEDCNFPIPAIREDGWLEGGWRNIHIEECGEPLVELERKNPTDLFAKFGPYSAYCNQDNSECITPFEKNHWRVQYAEQRLFARASIAKSLYAVSSYLPPGLKMIAFDAHRPPEVQTALYEVMVKRLVDEKGITEERARVEAQHYVSKPNINPPSPHSTGAAVDVALFDHTTGTMLDFGTKFDHMDPEAALRYYEDQVETENETAKLNRRYLYWLMRIGNFKGWPFEWWHFDHADDPVGAFISNKETAKFGYIENKPTADITLTEPKFYE